MSKLKIALAQTASGDNLQKNLENILHFSRLAAEQNCDAILFPEACLTGYFTSDAAKYAISFDDEIFVQISDFAAINSIDILVGFLEKSNDKLYISHAIMRADNTKSLYHKSHLGQWEKNFFTAGQSLDVYPLSDGTLVGFQVCVECHFAQITQTLSLKGANIIFAPHAIPQKSGDRKFIWSKYIPTRSYDYRVYMACCNQCDEDKFAGGCMATCPNGDIICENFEGKQSIATFDFDSKNIETYHDEDNKKMSSRYYPSLRKNELYL